MMPGISFPGSDPNILGTWTKNGSRWNGSAVYQKGSYYMFNMWQYAHGPDFLIWTINGTPPADYLDPVTAYGPEGTSKPFSGTNNWYGYAGGIYSLNQGECSSDSSSSSSSTYRRTSSSSTSSSSSSGPVNGCMVGGPASIVGTDPLMLGTWTKNGTHFNGHPVWQKGSYYIFVVYDGFSYFWIAGDTVANNFVGTIIGVGIYAVPFMPTPFGENLWTDWDIGDKYYSLYEGFC